MFPKTFKNDILLFLMYADILKNVVHASAFLDYIKRNIAVRNSYIMTNIG